MVVPNFFIVYKEIDQQDKNQSPTHDNLLLIFIKEDPPFNERQTMKENLVVPRYETNRK